MAKTSALSIIAALAVGLGSVAQAQTQTCGTAPYDPAHYVCHDNNFLCPIVAGEGLAYCNGACYSKYIYTCTNNALAQLGPLAAGTPYSLVSSNPAVPAVDGLNVSACGLEWTLGGKVCTYCPSNIPSGACPKDASSIVVSAGSNSFTSMSVSVPGGQQVFLAADWTVGYTQAHSAAIPAGATTDSLVALSGGGFINKQSGGWGWYACPAADGASGYSLHSANATTKASLASCTPVNLAVKPLPSDTIGAWQYS